MISAFTNKATGKPLTVIQFGQGTVELAIGHNKNSQHGILARTIPPTPVGTTMPATDAFEPDLVIAFDNLEGLNVFQGYIDRVRAILNKQNPTKQDEQMDWHRG